MRPPGSSDGDGPKFVAEAQIEADDVRELTETEQVQEAHAENDQYEKAQGQGGSRTVRHHGQKRTSTTTTFVTQSMARTDRQLRRLQDEVEAVLQLLADGEYAPDGILRHSRKLDRIRQQKDDSSRRKHRGELALREAQSGLTELDESKLSLAIEKLGTVGSLEALLELIADLGNGHPTRRIVVKRADHPSALDYASKSTPTTIYLDAPFMALGMFSPETGGDLGRTLTGQHALEVAARG